ncbi:aspartyl protease family protein [bacterium]|nr:aspartyl protease family protein [bacterium]
MAWCAGILQAFDPSPSQYRRRWYNANEMGLTSLTIEVANVARPDDAVQVECLVDSGAVHSLIPREILEQLGIKPYTEDEYSLANGELIKRERGPAVFKYDGRIGFADVIFGEPGDSNLLGAVTLEAMGLALDPMRRELKPMPLILGGFPR